MKNKNAKAHYVAKGKFHQLERHCDFRTIVVRNTIPGSNINIKGIIGNYECSSLAGSLFDASGLPNHDVDGKSGLLHAVCSSIDCARINPWRHKLDVVVIDVMSAIFDLPKSTKFERFQLLPLSFIKYIVKETSTSSTGIISYDSYYTISLKALKGDHLHVQYEVIEAADISIVSKKNFYHMKKQNRNQHSSWKSKS